MITALDVYSVDAICCYAGDATLATTSRTMHRNARAHMHQLYRYRLLAVHPCVLRPMRHQIYELIHAYEWNKLIVIHRFLCCDRPQRVPSNNYHVLSALIHSRPGSHYELKSIDSTIDMVVGLGQSNQDNETIACFVHAPPGCLHHQSIHLLGVLTPAGYMYRTRAYADAISATRHLVDDVVCANNIYASMSQLAKGTNKCNRCHRVKHHVCPLGNPGLGPHCFRRFNRSIFERICADRAQNIMRFDEINLVA